MALGFLCGMSCQADRIDRLQTHQPHESSHPFAIDQISLLPPASLSYGPIQFSAPIIPLSGSAHLHTGRLGRRHVVREGGRRFPGIGLRGWRQQRDHRRNKDGGTSAGGIDIAHAIGIGPGRFPIGSQCEQPRRVRLRFGIAAHIAIRVHPLHIALHRIRREEQPDGGIVVACPIVIQPREPIIILPHKAFVGTQAPL